MAPTGSLVALLLLAGADPAVGEPYGALREPAPQEFSAPGQAPLAERPPRGWAVEDPRPRPLAVESAEAKPLAHAANEALDDRQDQAAPESLKLAPPSKASPRTPRDRQPPSSAGAITSVVSSLAVVLGLFFVVVWLARRNSPKAALLLPAEVVEVLGRTPLTARQQMHVVRFGNKLLLLSVTPAGAAPLAEIEDPAEVDRLAGICQELQHGSISETFRQVFSQFGSEPARDDFAGAARE